MAKFARLVCGCETAFSCPSYLDVEVHELADIIRTMEEYPCLVLADIQAIQTI